MFRPLARYGWAPRGQGQRWPCPDSVCQSVVGGWRRRHTDAPAAAMHAKALICQEPQEPVRILLPALSSTVRTLPIRFVCLAEAVGVACLVHLRTQSGGLDKTHHRASQNPIHRVILCCLQLFLGTLVGH